MKLRNARGGVRDDGDVIRGCVLDDAMADGVHEVAFIFDRYDACIFIRTLYIVALESAGYEPEDSRMNTNPMMPTNLCCAVPACCRSQQADGSEWVSKML